VSNGPVNKMSADKNKNKMYKCKWDLLIASNP
jgi:hypothetical protein